MAPLKANTIISFILLFVLLLLPDETMSQRRRKGTDTVRDSLQTDTLKADSLRTDSLQAPKAKQKQPLDAPVIYS
ncbi:MAG: hypothetical protein RR365_09375, partial [Bacteroides sp.]